MNRVLAAVPRLAEQASRKLPVGQRSLTTSRATFQERVDITHIKKSQAKFQVDDGTPIYLKGGIGDKFLFGFTVILGVYGLGYGATVIYALSVPPKN